MVWQRESFFYYSIVDRFLWLDIFAPVYVLYCFLRRWKHWSVSRQWPSNTSTCSCGWVLNQTKLEMPGYVSHAPMELRWGVVWWGVGSGFRFMQTEFPPPQAANIMEWFQPQMRMFIRFLLTKNILRLLKVSRTRSIFVILYAACTYDTSV
jgi:hypothetical protein